MKWPLISIIITAYNYAHMLETAIESARLQDYPHLEILILDNASTDETPALLARYHDDVRVRAIRNDVNIGPVANHNKGARLARGKYLVFLSADDMLMPGHVSQAHRYLEQHPAVDIVYTPLYIMKHDGQIVQRREPELLAQYNDRENEFVTMLAFGCDMCLPTMLIPKRIYKTYGPFDESFVSWDYEILVRWAEAGVRFAYTNEPMAAFRAHLQQQTSTSNHIANGQLVRDYLRILQKFIHPANADRVDGYEQSIRRLLLKYYHRALAEGFVDNEQMACAIETFESQLDHIRAINAARSFQPKLSILVMAEHSLTDLEESLTSLVAQSDQDWVAMVIQQRGMSLASFCRRIDPQGRIRLVQLIERTTEGLALNTAMCISESNCFTFLRAGSTFQANHVAQIRAAFAAKTAQVLVSPAVLREMSTHQNIEDAFPDPKNVALILAAPIYPLESIAFLRRTVDAVLYCNQDKDCLVEWDLGVRLLGNFEWSMLDSKVSVTSNAASSADHFPHPDLLKSSEKVYQYFPHNDQHVNHLRVTYLESLRGMQRDELLTGLSKLTARQHVRVIRGTSLPAPSLVKAL